jgi:GTPase SAR1 family protein
MAKNAVMELITSVVVGDCCVGKTSMLFISTTNAYPNCMPVPFVDFYVSFIIDERRVNLLLWDTSASDEYMGERSRLYSHADIFIICFSLVSPDSLQSVQAKWIPELTKHRPMVPFLLVGLKSDGRDLELSVNGIQVVTRAEGEQMASTIGAAVYVECSARFGRGLEQVLEEAIRVALGSGETVSRSDSSSHQSVVNESY